MAQDSQLGYNAAINSEPAGPGPSNDTGPHSRFLGDEETDADGGSTNHRKSHTPSVTALCNANDDGTSKPVYWSGLPWYRFLGDALSIILSIGFLALGITVANLQGREKTQWSTRVVEATQLAASLWPVVFSGVVGNSIRTFANWKVQKGTSLRLLEQLLGSLTMANTVLSAYTLSAINVWTLCLILLWAFNPLGSQASLRSVYLESHTSTQNGTIGYKNYTISHMVGYTGLMGASAWKTMGPGSRITYNGVLTAVDSATQYCNGSCIGFDDLVVRLGGPEIAATQVAMDPWGNPRIPKIRHTPGYDIASPGRWLEVPWNESIQEYSSLIGNRYYGVNPRFVGNITFTISASYLDISNCTQWTCVTELTSYGNNSRRYHMTEDMIKWFSTHYKSFATKYNSSLDNAPYSQALWDLFTAPKICDHNKRSGRFSFAMDFATKYDPDGAVDTTVYIASGGDDSKPNNTCVTSCSAAMVYVDTNVFCRAQGSTARSVCGVNRIRQMLQPPNPPSDTLFATETFGNNTAPNAQCYFEIMGRDPTDQFSTYSERFIESPPTAFDNKDDASRRFITWSNLPIELLADRLSLLFNTFLDTSMDPPRILGNDLDDKSRLVNTTSIIDIPLSSTYDLDAFWISTYFVATAIMILAALSSLLIRCYLTTPQILGTVGGIVKDSPYFTHLAPPGNSTESGELVSKRLCRETVGLVDVQPSSDVGKVALAPVAMGEKVRKGRYYE